LTPGLGGGRRAARGGFLCRKGILVCEAQARRRPAGRGRVGPGQPGVRIVADLGRMAQGFGEGVEGIHPGPNLDSGSDLLG